MSRTIDGLYGPTTFTNDATFTNVYATEDVIAVGTIQGETIQGVDVIATGTMTAPTLNITNVTAQTISADTLNLTNPLNVNDGGTGSTTSTGSGSVVLSNSPTLTTPVLGAASATSLTLTTPLATGSGGTGTTLSTGTGANVLATAPTLILPFLGSATATALDLAVPLATTSGGTGATTATGSGSNVLQTSPTLINPVLGNATSTSISSTGVISTTDNTVTTSTTTGAIKAVGGIATQGSVSCIGLRAFGGNVIADAFVNANSTQNATTTNSGAISAPSGGISCLKDVFVGGDVKAVGYVTSSHIHNATSTSDGAISASNGGISCLKNVYAGGKIINEDTTQATAPTNGSIQTAGGLGVAKNIHSGGIIECTSSQNSTSTITGAVRVPNGGIGCARNIYSGGVITLEAAMGQNTFESIDDGPTQNASYSIRTKGGIQIDKSLRVVAGPINAGLVTAEFNKVVVNSSEQANTGGPYTGAIQTLGGATVGKNIIGYDAFYLPNASMYLRGASFDDCAQGTFTPNWTKYNSGDPNLPAITYVSRVGHFQNFNQWTMLYVYIEWIVPSSMPGISAAVDGIPGTYMDGSALLMQYPTNMRTFFAGSPYLARPFELGYDSVNNKWPVIGWRAESGATAPINVTYFSGADVGTTYKMCFTGLCRRTTL